MHRIASSQGGVGQLNNTVASATVDSLNPNCIPISCLELKAWDPFLKPTFPAAHLQGCHNGRFWVKMTVRTSTRIHVYPADAAAPRPPHGRGPAWTRASADLARTGTWGSWGSKTEHFFLSFPVANNQKNKKKLFFYFFIFFRASARTQQPIRARRVRGYRGKRAREGEGRERSSSVRTRLCPCGREPFCPQVTS
jgi:hypothetical protein